MASILRKINEVEECTHRLHDPFINTLVACDNREENAFQILRLLASVLFEPSETFGEMSAPDERLQNRQSTVEFFIAKPLLRPFQAMIIEKLVPLVQRIGCEK